jgi:hypothetical protein
MHLKACLAFFLLLFSAVLFPCTTTAVELPNLPDKNQIIADALAQVGTAPLIKVREGKASNWSGYAIETNLTSPQKNAVTDVKGSWVVPNLTCDNKTTYSSNWVGIDGYSSPTVEQLGTEHDCYRGKASYSAWYEMYPRSPHSINIPVKAGDTISAEVQYTNNGRFILTMDNQTTGKHFSTTQILATAKRQSAEWITEAPWLGSVLPLSNFGTTNFNSSQATVNGHTGSISDGAWQNDPITMINPSQI